MMELQLLGQAGVEITLSDGYRIVIDPYLSDALFLRAGERFARRVPRREIACPDALLLTHDHDDHTDLPTLIPWLSGKKSIPIFAPHEVYALLSPEWTGRHNVMVARPGVEITVGGARITAVPASHEKEGAVGFLVEAEGKCLYFTGDTLYTRAIPAFLAGTRIDVMFPCINGLGNNMNARDAARLTLALSPRLAVPLHWDMFIPFGADPAKYTAALGGAVPSRILGAYDRLTV